MQVSRTSHHSGRHSRKQGLRALGQHGLTLIEVLIGLAIFALVVAGATAQFGTASTSQSTTQLTYDLNTIRSATKSLYFGQGGYGTTSLSEVLINSKKVPATMVVTGTAPSRVINHALNGTVAITGANASFTVTTTAMPTAVCIGLATMNGWDSIKVGTAAARTPPVSPSQASTDCSAAATQDMVFTGS